MDEIAERFRLSDRDLSELFHVSHTTIANWRERGVPPTRVADVERIRELARYFYRKFQPERIPQIVRSPGAGLGGRSVLKTIAASGPDPVYAYLERLFAYLPR